MLLLILCSGGVSAKEVVEGMADAFHAVRRGGDADKPMIVPLTGAQPKPRKERDLASRLGEFQDPTEGPAASPPPAAVPRPVIRRKDEGDRTIPLE